jgi:hypothetical protein
LVQVREAAADGCQAPVVLVIQVLSLSFYLISFEMLHPAGSPINSLQELIINGREHICNILGQMPQLLSTLSLVLHKLRSVTLSPR